LGTGASGNAIVREGVLYSRRKHCIFEGRQIKRDKRQIKRDRDRGRRDTEIKTLKRDHRTDNRRGTRTAQRHNVRGL
jgi:hypothetical protein